MLPPGRVLTKALTMSDEDVQNVRIVSRELRSSGSTKETTFYEIEVLAHAQEACLFEAVVACTMLTLSYSSSVDNHQ